MVDNANAARLVHGMDMEKAIREYFNIKLIEKNVAVTIIYSTRTLIPLSPLSSSLFLSFTTLTPFPLPKVKQTNASDFPISNGKVWKIWN